MRRVAVALAVFAFLGVSAYELAHIAKAVAQLSPVVWRRPWGGIERYEPSPDYRAARTVYPYSVVPGGVVSEDELETSMAKDPVVARHYRDILPARLHPTRLNAAVNVYASYRSANSVRWTSHTTRVQKGEMVLGDGANLIRMRCGNRLTFTPPAEPSTSSLPDATAPRTPGISPVEPPELVLEHGMPPILAPPGITTPGSPAMPPSKETPESEVAHFWPPSTSPPEWCCGPGGFPGTWRPTYPNRPDRPGRPEPPAPGIPEPTTSLLMVTGAFVILIRMARRPWR